MTERSVSPLLDGLDHLSQGPQWLSEQRRTAAQAVLSSGLPTKKTEAWRFTSVRPITGTEFTDALPDYDDQAIMSRIDERLGTDDGWRLPVVHGVPRFDLCDSSRSSSRNGVRVRSIADVLRDDAQALEPYLGSAVESSHFAALNSARFKDGVWVHVDSDLKGAIHLVHLAARSSAPSISYPRVLITTEANSALCLVETHLGAPEGKAHLTNAAVEVLVSDNASVEHIVVHEDAAFHVSRVDVRQAKNSRYRSKVITFGGRLLRTDTCVMLEGPGAECELSGAYHAQGDDHVDHHTRVEHRSAQCTSRQNYRGVLDDRSTAVFDGIVIVHRDAQKTEAHQENRNLLLSDKANVHTKPHLEIDADDVICSHGATVGSLDEEQLFYMRARGIPEKMARALLTYAFLKSIVDTIADSTLRTRLEEALSARLPQGDVIRSLK